MSNNRGVEDYKWAVKEIRLGMKCCGVYFKNDLPKWQRSLISVRAALNVIIVMNFILIPSIPALIKVWGDLTLIIDNLIVSLPYTLSICHFLTMWFNKKEINELFQMIKEDWITSEYDFERNIMMRNTKISRTIVRFAYLIVAWLVAMHNMPFWILGISPRTYTNLTDGAQPLIAQTVYFYDLTIGINFKLTAIGQTMSSITVGLAYSTAGCIFYTFILHVGGQLKILKILMEHIFENHEKESNINYKSVPKFIRSVVKRHQRIIRFVDSVENIFNIMFLQQFIGMIITISTEGFLVILMLVGDVQVPVVVMGFTILYVSYCMIMTLMYCTGGEYLIESSTAIHSAAYESSWYNSAGKYQVELSMIILRAQKPLWITAGKFVPLSLSTYADMLKTSASYMSVLLAMKA
uniref:Odorant receptor n=1 Tax=Meteorus pulchricornis TaxID=51522 RepID=A0A1S5VFK6_9HYME|nr:olfactory receptor 16 [Meteorus pulchricornis]